MSKISFFGSVTDSDALGNRRWRIVSTLLFVVFSLALLARYGYVWKWVESLSLFVPDPVFFRSFLNNPGGMLAYAGAFLTQFLYYPFWGSCLLVLLLLGTQQLTCRLFRLEGVSYLCSFIPSGFGSGLYLGDAEGAWSFLHAGAGRDFRLVVPGPFPLGEGLLCPFGPLARDRCPLSFLWFLCPVRRRALPAR